MKFDDDLIAEVQAQAPPGVHFEDDEVHAALVNAVNTQGTTFAIFLPSAVQRAAYRALAARRATGTPEETTAP